jgi:hypothetical protein
MKILYLTNKIIAKHDDLQYLTHFADLDDIELIDGNESAEKYIAENQVNHQAHLDFIIVDFIDVEDDVRDKFVMRLRANPFTYSSQNFMISSIPVILIKDWDFMRDGYTSAFYNKIIYRSHSDQVKIQFIGEAINGWLQEIGNDLSHLNLDLDLKFDRSKIDWLLNHRGYKLQVLSHEFLRNQSKLQYIWFGDNLKTFDISMNSFYDLLKKSESHPHIRNEKEIHQCLLKNKRLLLGEFYNDTHYEKQYYLPNSMKYVEPDFTNMPFIHFRQHPEIFEVKLPSQKFVRRDKKAFYRDTTRAMEQVSVKYFNYFTNPENGREIEDKIKYSSNKFNYTLLMGRKKDKEENLEYIENTIRVRNFKLLTYDDLPENFQRLYERTSKYHLK